jgi:hypothetical protein
MFLSKSFIYFIFYLFLFHKIIVTSEQRYLRMRNIFLRIYLANEKSRPLLMNEYSQKITQKIKNKVNHYYYKMMNSLYDINMFYSNLKDEEKELLEFIISLCN